MTCRWKETGTWRISSLVEQEPLKLMREERNLYPLLTEMGERRISRVKSRFFETEPGTKTNSPPAVGHMGI